MKRSAVIAVQCKCFGRCIGQSRQLELFANEPSAKPSGWHMYKTNQVTCLRPEDTLLPLFNCFCKNDLAALPFPFTSTGAPLSRHRKWLWFPDEFGHHPSLQSTPLWWFRKPVFRSVWCRGSAVWTVGSVEHGEEGLECSHDHLPCFAPFFLCFFRPTLPSGLRAPHRLLRYHLQTTWCHPEDPVQVARSSPASRSSIGHGLCSSPSCLSYCWRSNSSHSSSRIAKTRIPSFLCHDIHCTSSLGPNDRALHICSKCAPLASPFPSLCLCPSLSCWTKLRVSWDWTLCSCWGSWSRPGCWILLAGPWLALLPASVRLWSLSACRSGHRSCRSCSRQSRWCLSAALRLHHDRRPTQDHSIHGWPARVPHVQLPPFSRKQQTVLGKRISHGGISCIHLWGPGAATCHEWCLAGRSDESSLQCLHDPLAVAKFSPDRDWCNSQVCPWISKLPVWVVLSHNWTSRRGRSRNVLGHPCSLPWVPFSGVALRHLAWLHSWRLFFSILCFSLAILCFLFFSS